MKWKNTKMTPGIQMTSKECLFWVYYTVTCPGRR